MPNNDDANNDEFLANQERKAARKQMIKTIAIQTGTAIAMTAVTTATAFVVGEALKQKAKPMKVVLPDDYAKFYNIAE